MKTALKRALTATVASVAALSLTPALSSATAPELDFARYPAVDAKTYVSYNYDNNGRAFFRAGMFYCGLGSTPGRIACKGRPATAPPGVQGTYLNNSQGPWWVSPEGIFAPSIRLLPNAHYRAKVLPVGRSIHIYDIICARPRPAVLTCETRGRAFVVSPRWHKFISPAGDHAYNPPKSKLPPSLR
ncbi:hypothetical protein [Gordonia sp. (in: high G+C Gram-positive bacteria)]|uniref:hypothetical protein n=1 Tax=Gordonia sp. (in: high G+C Gram-positive bacteria) TaxID=84139 RepID=UPI0039E55578